MHIFTFADLVQGLIGLILLLAVLYAFDRAMVPRRRHHDHLIPGTPRSPRSTR